MIQYIMWYNLASRLSLLLSLLFISTVTFADQSLLGMWKGQGKLVSHTSLEKFDDRLSEAVVSFDTRFTIKEVLDQFCVMEVHWDIQHHEYRGVDHEAQAVKKHSDYHVPCQYDEDNKKLITAINFSSVVECSYGDSIMNCTFVRSDAKQRAVGMTTLMKQNTQKGQSVATEMTK